MNANKRNLNLDLKKMDEHVITQEEYDEIPELTDEFFNNAVYSPGPRPGRPGGTSKKSPVTIRLDNDVVEFFRSMGKGWQTHVNDILKEWKKNHSEA